MSDEPSDWLTTDKPTDWIICGRNIGTATGWDQADTWIMQIYNLVPHPNYKGPVSECISIDFESGFLETYNESGDLIERCDLLSSIADCPIERTTDKELTS